MRRIEERAPVAPGGDASRMSNKDSCALAGRSAEITAVESRTAMIGSSSSGASGDMAEETRIWNVHPFDGWFRECS